MIGTESAISIRSKILAKLVQYPPYMVHRERNEVFERVLQVFDFLKIRRPGIAKVR